MSLIRDRHMSNLANPQVSNSRRPGRSLGGADELLRCANRSNSHGGGRKQHPYLSQCGVRASFRLFRSIQHGAAPTFALVSLVPCHSSEAPYSRRLGLTGTPRRAQELPLDYVFGGKEEIAKANRPNWRLFTVPRATAATPQDDVVGAQNVKWLPSNSTTAARFSAVRTPDPAPVVQVACSVCLRPARVSVSRFPLLLSRPFRVRCRIRLPGRRSATSPPSTYQRFTGGMVR